MSSKRSKDLSNREKILIAALFIAVFSISLFKLGGLSTFETMRNLYLEQAWIRAEIEQLDTVLASEQQLRTRYVNATPDLQHYQQFLPATAQQPVSIGALEKLINSGPGRLLTMRVNESIDYGDYSAQNIAIKITDLNAFPADLIFQLENFSQLLIIEQLEWQAGETETDTISLSLSLYYLN